MELRNRRILLLVAIIFIAIGFTIIVNFSADPISKAFQWQQNPTCNDFKACVTHSLNLFELIIPHNNRIEQFNGWINFQSKDAFYVNNPIDFQVNVTSDQIVTPSIVKKIGNMTSVIFTAHKIKQIFFTLDKMGVNYDRYDPNILSGNYLRTHAKFDPNLIELKNMSNNQFYASRNDVLISPSIDVTVDFFIVYDDDKVTMVQGNQTLLTVEPQSVGTEAIQSHETRLTNKIVLGLTWMAIGVAPILLGSDIILRLIFEGGATFEDIRLR